MPRGPGGDTTAGPDAESLIRVRNLKVWFSQRKGLLREILSSDSRWVRAVDDVSFDVRRGEVFCLVGESGCGKTTTGKALLQLAPATGGDVFLEMPGAEYGRYERLRDRGGNQRALDGIRRRYSLTWKETLPWTLRQRLVLATMILAAAYLAFYVPAFVTGLFASPFQNGWTVMFYGIATGLVLGVVAAMPPGRPWKRAGGVVAILAFVVTIVSPVLTGLVNDIFVTRVSVARFSVIDALGAPWSDIFAMVVGLSCAPIAAYAAGAAFMKWRQQQEDLSGIKMRTMRKRLHLIFQDPYESLNPKQSIYEIVSEPLRVNRIVTDQEEIAALVAQALNDAGLRPPEDFMFRFPHEVSGGQRQRVSIAAALVLRPDFIVADEPVSMLDVSIRTDILQLMMELRRTRGLTYLFITHDLSLAWVLADRIAVMYLGKIVEIGTAAQVIREAKHPYTQALISVVPSPDPRHKAKRTILKGERPDPVDIPTGCRFHPRCPMAFEKCGWNAGELKELLETALPSELRARVGEIVVETPALLHVVGKDGAADRLADDLRTHFAEKRDVQLAFRAVTDVGVLGGQVAITLHPWTEPELIELSPGNAVACHLVQAPAPVPEPVPTAA